MNICCKIHVCCFEKSAAMACKLCKLDFLDWWCKAKNLAA